MQYPNVLLFSGGVDSFVAYFYLKALLGEAPQPIYFDLGTPYTKKEIEHFERIRPLMNHDIIIDKSLKWLGKSQVGDKAFVPHRNLYLAMAANTIYGAKKMWIVGLKDDNVSDKNKEIFTQWSDIVAKTSANGIFDVDSPFWDLTKADVVKWMHRNYDHINLAEATLSCYSKGKGHCHSCPACFRRNVALFSVGYDLPFFDSKILMEYKDKIGEGIYDTGREDTMEKYINHIIEQDKLPF